MARSIVVRADSAVASTRPWRARICLFLAAAARSRRTLAENASTVAGWSLGGPYLHRTQVRSTFWRLRYRTLSEPGARCKSAARIGRGRGSRRWDLHVLQARPAPEAHEPSGAPTQPSLDAGGPWRGQPASGPRIRPLGGHSPVEPQSVSGGEVRSLGDRADLPVSVAVGELRSPWTMTSSGVSATARWIGPGCQSQPSVPWAAFVP